MIALIMALLVTISPQSGYALIHYPIDREWHEICIYSEGADYGLVTDIDWEAISCWKPFYRVEQYQLRLGTRAIKVMLETDKGVEWTSWINVRP